MSPLDFMNLFGSNMMQASAMPDQNAAASQLAMLGDPGAFNMLFPELTKMGLTNNMMTTPTNSDPLLMAQMGLPGVPNVSTAPTPGVPAPAAGAGVAPIVDKSTPASDADKQRLMGRPTLTPEQMMKLSQMITPSAESMRMPQAPAPQVGHFNGNMAQLQAGPPAQFSRPTLAQLLYGRR